METNRIFKTIDARGRRKRDFTRGVVYAPSSEIHPTILSDVDGSYTGVSVFGNGTPVQDADDL